MTNPDSDFVAGCYQALHNAPLPPKDPRYVAIFERLGEEDPVQLLKNQIRYSGSESVQFVSGFRGSGKTTQFLRLQDALESDTDGENVVLYSDALQYMSQVEPLEAPHFLISLAAAFGEATDTRLKTSSLKEDYFTRLKNYLTRTEVEVGGLGVSASAELGGGVLGGIKTSADLKLALHTTPTLVQRINVLLQDRLGQLRAEVAAFIDECRAAFVKDRKTSAVRLVFIFDQLEQIRSTGANAQRIIDSLCELFTQHAELLRFPAVHLVYAVPPWLPFARPGLPNIKRIPAIKCWNNDVARTECPAGLGILRDVLRLRLGEERLARLFGTRPGEFPPALEETLLLSAGDLRGLLRLAQNILVRATTLPVSQGDVDRALNQVRLDFALVAEDEARWLDQIERERDATLEATTPESINRITRLLDTYFVVCFKNGKAFWYDVHPLVREQVQAVMKRLRARRPADPPAPPTFNPPP